MLKIIKLEICVIEKVILYFFFSGYLGWDSWKIYIVSVVKDDKCWFNVLMKDIFDWVEDDFMFVWLWVVVIIVGRVRIFFRE